MKGGRRNLKHNSLNGCPEPQPGESLMRVVSLRGSNLIEVENSHGVKTLCMLPAKFRKSLWIKTGNYVLVEEGDREKAADAGNKVTGTIVQVLYEEHVRALRTTSFWPPSFVDTSEKARMANEILPEEKVLRTPVLSTPVLTTPVLSTPVLTTPVLRTRVLRTRVLSTPVLRTPVLSTPVEENGDDSEDEDDGLPPLEANRNRQQPTNLFHGSGCDSDSDYE
ncbi:unnamed protein product [Calypogeia fissa]